VFLKVGEIVPKGAILRGKEGEKNKGVDRRGETTQRDENAQPLIELTSVVYSYDLLVSCKF